MRYFLIVGEASGDLHASNLMREIKKLDHKARFSFCGGDLMSAQGGTLIQHYREMAIMGFFNVLIHLRKIRSNFNVCKQAIARFEPDVLILVDYGGFNLRMARYVRKTIPSIKIVYYIPPKIWAWNEKRVHTIKRYVDKVYTIFPFETDFYASHDFEVEYVGNPTVEAIQNRPNQDQSFEAFCTKNNLYPKPVIALLAGSRKKEIETCLPRMYKAASQFTDYQLLVAGAPGIDPEFYLKVLKNEHVKLVFGQTYDILKHAQLAVVNSGTATLETAILRTPQVVVYHLMAGYAAKIAMKLMLKIKHVSLVNLLTNKATVKELIGADFSIENLRAEINNILLNKEYCKQMLSDYDQIVAVLGKNSCANHTARKIVTFINEYAAKPNTVSR